MFDFRIGFPVDTDAVQTKDNIKDLVQQVRQEIEVAAQVTPIRVQNVMVDFTQDHMYAIATLVEFPAGVPGLNMSDIPQAASLPLADAVDNLKSAVSEGQLRVFFISNERNNLKCDRTSTKIPFKRWQGTSNPRTCLPSS